MLTRTSLCLLCLCLIIGASACCAADGIPVQNVQGVINGVVNLWTNGVGNGAPAPVQNEVPGLEFSNGDFLHGSLVGINADRQEVQWKGDGIGAPFTFPFPQVRRVVFNGESRGDKSGSLVKFRGGDWLTGEIAGMEKDSLRLKLADGSELGIPRTQIEWIYFSKSPPGECYDGPAGGDGWESDGNWKFSEAGMSSSEPSMIWRNFSHLPDQVEYLLDLEGGGAEPNFSVTLQSQVLGPRAVAGGIRLVVQRQRVALVSQLANTMQSESAELPELVPGGRVHGFRINAPLRLRVFEDCTAGRIAVYLGDRLVRDWQIARIPSGANQGAFSFQPLSWKAGAEISIPHFKVTPWDGHFPEEGSRAKSSDQLGILGGGRYTGKLLGIVGREVQISTKDGLAKVPLEGVALLRFGGSAKAQPDRDPVAHLRLGGGGELDLKSVGLTESGALDLHPFFADRLALPVSLCRSLDLLGDGWDGAGSELLLFKNGDQLRGTLHSAGKNGSIGWRTDEKALPIDISASALSGIRLNAGGAISSPKNSTFVMLGNGDSLPGDLLALDSARVTLDSASMGHLTLSRDAIRKIYFAGEAGLPVLDGSSYPEYWLRGPVFGANAYYNRQLLPAPAGARTPKLWRYLDGEFSFRNVQGGQIRTVNGSYIGCYFEAMPQSVEFSFDISGNVPLFLSGQVFFYPGCPGYMLELDPEGVSVFDLAPGQANQGIAQRHIAFSGKIKPGASKRHVQLLADRPSGKLAVVVDGVLMGQFARKAGRLRYPLGSALTLAPQMNVACTLANLWIGPWDGRLPGEAQAEVVAGANSVLLENGDLTEGKVESATPDEIRLVSELGTLDVPVERITSIDFGGKSAPAASGVRMRFIGGGTVTASSWTMEHDLFHCATQAAGELNFPVAALQEIDFPNDSSGN